MNCIVFALDRPLAPHFDLARVLDSSRSQYGAAAVLSHLPSPKASSTLPTGGVDNPPRRQSAFSLLSGDLVRELPMAASDPLSNLLSFQRSAYVLSLVEGDGSGAVEGLTEAAYCMPRNEVKRCETSFKEREKSMDSISVESEEEQKIASPTVVLLDDSRGLREERWISVRFDVDKASDGNGRSVDMSNALWPCRKFENRVALALALYTADVLLPPPPPPPSYFPAPNARHSGATTAESKAQSDRNVKASAVEFGAGLSAVVPVSSPRSGNAVAFPSPNAAAGAALAAAVAQAKSGKAGKTEGRRKTNHNLLSVFFGLRSVAS